VDEVRLEREAPAETERFLGQREHDLECRRPEALRPGEVAGAEPLEQSLLDRVLRDQRQAEPHREPARDRRLACGRRPRDHDEERHVRPGHLAHRCPHGHDFEVEPADKEDARSIMLALMRAHAKLDDILYILGEDDGEEEEENETDG
jgi:hypothetical protein